MPDYKMMYHTLFNAVSQAIELLKAAQCQAEEIYVSETKSVLTLMPSLQEEQTND